MQIEQRSIITQTHPPLPQTHHWTAVFLPERHVLLVQRQHLQIKSWSSHGFACVPYHSQPVHGGVRSQGHPHSPEPPICVAEICWRHLRDDPWVLCQRVHRTLQQHWWEHKFTTEPEMEGKLPFLDSCTTLNDDGSLDLTVYRKPTQTSIWTLTLTTISNTRGLLYEHSSTEQTAWSPNRSRNILRSDMSSPHSKPMPTRTGSLRSPHPKTTPTPRVTPQGDRPAPAWAYFIGTSKKLARIFKNRRGLPQALQHTALHPGPPQRQDTWSQKVWCRLWNPVSRMPCPVCRWNCPHTGDKDERPPKTAVGEHEHPIKMDDVKVIAREDNMWRRKIRESIEIRTRPSTSTRDMSYPHLIRYLFHELTTNMHIARARCECQTAVGSSGLNARLS